jgi:quinol-cytochrome oxidoreductase complex cytochrome b subunit
MSARTRRLYDWFDKRFNISPLISEAQRSINFALPSTYTRHNRSRIFWFGYPFYYTGAIVAFLAIMQGVTGLLLAFHYVPSAVGEPGTPTQAYMSVQNIMKSVPLGALIRGIHQWGANLLVAALVIHAFWAFFRSPYRVGREISWVLGALSLGLALAYSFSGYLLPWDQLGFWAATISVQIMRSIPILGDLIAQILLGGTALSPVTLVRMYFYHVSLLPVVAIVLVGAHMMLVVLQGVSEPEEVWKTEKKSQAGVQKEDGPLFGPFVPQQITPVLILSLVTLGVVLLLGAYAVQMPGDPANRFLTPQFIAPEWYFLWAYGLLKWVGWVYEIVGFVPPATVFGVDLLSAKVVGILVAAAMFLVLVLMPVLDRGDEVRVLRRPLKTTIGIWAIGLLSTLTLYALNEILSSYLSVPIDTVNPVLGSIVIVVPLAVAAPFYVILRRQATKVSAREA